MNNKIFLRLISLIMTVSIVFAVGGCKKNDGSSADKDTKSETTVASDSAAVQPKIDKKSGKAVISYSKVNSEGKTESATKVYDVSKSKLNEITMGSKADDIFKDKNKKQQFVDKAENNGIDKDKQDEIINNAEKWVEFNYIAYVANTSTQRLITSFLEISKKNDNVVVNKMLDCEYSITSGSATGVLISGFVNIGKYPDEESLLKELNGMNVQLVYTLADDSTTDIDDWSTVKQMKMPVSF